MLRAGPASVAAGALLLVVLVAWRLQEPRRATARFGAAATLDGDAVTALLAGARGTDPVVCTLAVRVLDDRYGWGRGGIDSWSGWPPGGGEAASAVLAQRLMEGVEGAAIAPLAAALRDDDRCVRRLAAPLLGRMRDARAVAALRSALADTAAATRAAAAVGLGFARDGTPGGPALVTALSDASADVRSGAAWALGRREDAAATGPLTALLRHDPDPLVRRMAAWALGRTDKN
jgi:hypothetical protein